MPSLNRRHFLASTAAVPFAALPVAGAAPEKSSAPLKFKLGLVTYNVAANWDLRLSSKSVGLSVSPPSSSAPRTSTVSSRP